MGAVSPASLTSHAVDPLFAGPQAGRGAWHPEHQGTCLRDWQHILQVQRWPRTRRCTCCLYSELTCLCLTHRCLPPSDTKQSECICARQASLGVPHSRCPSQQHHAGPCLEGSSMCRVSTAACCRAVSGFWSCGRPPGHRFSHEMDCHRPIDLQHSYHDSGGRLRSCATVPAVSSDRAAGSTGLCFEMFRAHIGNSLYLIL